MSIEIDLVPCSQDSEGLMWNKDEANELLIKMVTQEMYFNRRVKKVTKEIDEATAKVHQATDMFERALDVMISKETDLIDKTKKVSGKLRDTGQKLGDSIVKIEKMANFDNLERYVALIERAEIAFSALAELEKTGKLEKIASAIR